MKIIFIGTPKFASIILEKLIDNNYKPILAITAPDKPVGRKQMPAPSEVKLIAKKHNIPIEQPIKIADIKEKIKKEEPDLIILTAYGQIIPKDILDIPKYKSINIHPSLLPKYRGASPIQCAILNGDEKTGITIYIMDEKMDHGKILAISEYKIKNNASYKELSEELAIEGANLLLKTLPDIFNNKVKPRPQNDSEATYTKIIKKEDGHINWNKPAIEIERQIRAFSVWPGSFTFWEQNDKILRIKIIKAENIKADDSPIPGKAAVSPEKELLVGSKNSFLLIKEIQLEGKNPISSKDFLKGYPDIINITLK